jgi:23S rRNA (adenine2503-C2)-methyltransferase
MIDLRDQSLAELKDLLVSMGEKPFRAGQLFRWISRGVTDYTEISDLSAPLREKLSQTALLTNMKTKKVQVSDKDGTRKYLFQLMDGNTVETVLMKYEYGSSICVSSQVGCAMGCNFCASAIGGLERNLTAGEMLGQLLEVQRESGEKINHIVVMGTGEPLANYSNLAKFIRLVHEKDGLNIGLRNITVSTCGLISQIDRFAKDFPQVNLAISLHAPTDALRSSMMPINEKYPIDALLAACKKYIEQTGRRVTFEYALVEGVNDTTEMIDLLARKLRGMLCHVNLIPLNPIMESGLVGTRRKHAKDLQARLEAKGISATVRRELGADIDGACGQLRQNVK